MRCTTAGSRLLAFHRRHGIGGLNRNATPPTAPAIALFPPRREPDVRVDPWSVLLLALAGAVLWLALIVNTDLTAGPGSSASDAPPSAQAVTR